jgi:hypothetical protein
MVNARAAATAVPNSPCMGLPAAVYMSHYTVSLVTTVPHYGGRRWWFICPSMKARCSKLYLPLGAITFASRQAYGLTYHSCQRSFRPDRALRSTERLARQMAKNEAKFQALLKRANHA